MPEYCGGELITELDDLPACCPNCGGTPYPCPCGGDGVLPDEGTMMGYQQALDFLDAIANDDSLLDAITNDTSLFNDITNDLPT